MNPVDAAMAMREMIQPKYVLPIHYCTTPQLCRTPAKFKQALGNASGAPQMLTVNPDEKIEF